MRSALPLLLSLAALASEWDIAGPFGGSATALAIDPSNPDVLLAGARGAHLFKTTNGGQSWQPLPLPYRFPGAVNSLWIDPSNPKHYLAATHDIGSPFAGLYESRDAGASWRHVEELRGMAAFAIAAFPKDSRHLAVGTRNGAWISQDNAASWQRLTPANDPELQAVTSLAFDPQKSDTLYVGTTHLPWKTTDSGRTWKTIHDGMIDDSDVFSIHVNPARPNEILASACSGIYTSLNGGALWRKFKGIPGTHRRTHVIRQHPSDPRSIYAATTLGLLRSQDSGATWPQLNDYVINALVIDPRNPNRLFIATENYGILLSGDGGKTFQTRSAGFVQRAVSHLTAGDGKFYLSIPNDGPRGGVFESASRGAAWFQTSGPSQLSAHQVHTVAAHPAFPNLLYAAGLEQLLQSNDNGRTWKPQTLLNRRARIHDLHLLKTKTAPQLLAATSEGLFRSTSQGPFAEIPLGRHKGIGVYSLVASDASSRVLAARTAAGIFISADYGAHWLALDAPFEYREIFDVTLNASPDDPIFIATSQGLYRFYSGEWRPARASLGKSTVSAVRYHPQIRTRVYAAQFGKIWISNDQGDTWKPLPDPPLPGLTIRRLWFPPTEPYSLFAVTVDFGVLILKRAESGPGVPGSHLSGVN